MLVSSKLQLLPSDRAGDSDRAGESCERPAGVRHLTAEQQVGLHSAAWGACPHAFKSFPRPLHCASGLTLPFLGIVVLITTWALP